ncbi:hypothetical protein BDP27DRAFT_1330522, partial [Rhodocollybia butyracea]
MFSLLHFATLLWRQLSLALTTVESSTGNKHFYNLLSWAQSGFSLAYLQSCTMPSIYIACLRIGPYVSIQLSNLTV